MASSGNNNVDIRTARLTKFFHDLIYGNRTLNSSKDGKLFIEALCSQTDPASCSHKLISSPAGLSVVQSSVRLDISASFMNEHAARLLQYLQAPSLKGIDSSAVLVRILTSLVEPPFFWDAFTQAFRGHVLTPAASHAFAWLLLELVRFPGNTSSSYVALARSPDITDLLLKSPDGETRILAQKIKHSLSLDSRDLQIDAEVKPGGRHDNDHADHRNISIMPTTDELLSRERPFIRMADFADDPSVTPTLSALHVDNQFRLLREDMLGEIRKEVQILTGVKTGRHKGIIVHDLHLVGVDIGTDRKERRPWGVVLQSKNELPQLKKIEPSKRKAYLVDNKHILRRGTMACLLVDSEPVAFPTIHRNEEELSKMPAKLIVQFQDDSNLSHAMSKLKTGQDIKVIQLDTAVFAFEPFLKQLQEMKELPLSEELLYWEEGGCLKAPSFQPTAVIEKLKERAGGDLQNLLRTKQPIRLDASQMDSLCASLSQRVSLVQGPPGTGKSFIGALIARVLHDHTSQVILVVCFTNHALDQFLEDLMDIGIPSSSMVRLGGKSTDRTKPLMIREQVRSKLSPAQWDRINKAQVRLEEHESKLQNAFVHFFANTSKQQIIDYLEFAEEDLPFSEAFCVPVASDGETTVNKKGKAVSKFYLLDRWTRGAKDAGAFQHILPQGAAAVWNMVPEDRKACQARWQAAILEDLVSEVCRVGQDFNKDEAEIDRIFAERDMNIIKGKRIIACTTNGAAKFTRAIQSASPGVVLVEEAGEILEAHILTAMGQNTEQLILIGDHQQLRPKCNSYELTVDGGNGYDLDRSLFERLVRKGFPHTTLTKQHRMRPEISSIIRHMTYHNLTDADATLDRDNLRGFRDNVMFINHSELEVELEESREVRDGSSASSKQNLFEASMILKCVRYLAQQGYGSDKMVVLTPYLGQLKLLRDELSRENDPILNDLDKVDLVRAGLLSDLGSKSSKAPLRISTIDNYQGEESDIVIASLTRSNASRDIGFMKSQVLRIKSKVDTSIRQGTDLKTERLGLVLLGNPGTGKTTVARHYAKVLTSLKVLPGDGFVETTGSRLAHGGVTEVKDHLKILEKAEGGIYFIDEAYQLAEGHNYGGKTVLDFLLAEIENLAGKIVFVFAGYRKQMEKFFEHNPGFSSRIPYTLSFNDYTDSELLGMLQYQMGKFYITPMDVEGGVDGLYMRIAVRRLGRGRGRDGFGNARALENLFTRIRERQSDRLTKERRDGLSPNDNFISKEDLIGPDPSQAILKCEAWEKLQKLTGLKPVKDSVRSMIDLIKTNYDREIEEKRLIEVSLNRVFLGSPGTGKTTVAKLYGRILADVGLLSNGEVVTKNPADFIGSVMGQSEANTKAILATTVGKVLIIDEAYMLHSGSGGGGGPNVVDMYKTAVIDTIVAEVQSVPGEDRCVLLLGYEDQMIEMFQNVNPGLTRRFQLSDAFRFEDFSDAELEEILLLKLETQGLGATDRAVSVAIDSLSRARNGLNFGNGGDVENLISKAKSNYQARQSKLPAAERSIDFLFEPQDFDPDFDRALSAETNLRQLFKDVIGCESIIKKLDGYLKVAKGMRAQGLDPTGQIPMNFIFKGPPGTGKTTTARKFGQVYYDLGFLSHVEVIECSATDLIGTYVGQTGPKTIKQLERGLGKVLFVDEAYRLGEGMYAQEAVNELVDTMTKPKFAGKLVIILAGYDNDMNNLLRMNEGLSSRFADEITFPSLNPEYCLQLLSSRLEQSKIQAPALNNPRFHNLFDELTELSGWGNARDIETLAKSMVRAVYQNNTKGGQLILSEEVATTGIETMLAARRARNQALPVSRSVFPGQPQSLLACQDALQSSSNTSTAIQHSVKPLQEEPAQGSQKPAPKVIEEKRDAGVSDAIWAQLQTDKKAAELYAERQEKIIRDQQHVVKAAKEAEKKLAAVARALQGIQAKNEHEALELLRKREEARIKDLEARAERERIEKEFERMRKAEEERKRQDAKAQAKLRKMGICPMGFQWIKQNGGCRCSAGGHWVDEAQLGL